MTLDERLQELGVNMAAVSGLRKIEFGESNNSRMQDFVDRGLGEHVKWAVDLLEETHTASDFTGGEDSRVNWIYERPSYIFTRSLEAAELLEVAGRQDTIQKWGELYSRIYNKGKSAEHSLFVSSASEILQNLIDAGAIGGLESWAIAASIIPKEKGSNKSADYLYRNSIPMFQALNAESWVDYFGRWCEWALNNGTLNGFDFERNDNSEIDAANSDIKSKLDKDVATVVAFRKYDDLDRFGRVFDALTVHYSYPERVKLATTFREIGGVYETFAKHNALAYFDKILETAESDDSKGAKFNHAFEFMKRSSRALESLDSIGKLDRFDEWFKTSKWHEDWAIEKGNVNQTNAGKHYLKAVEQDIPFDKITPICWALNGIGDGDYASPTIRQAIMSELPNKEKGQRLNVYKEILKGCSESAVAKLFYAPLDKVDSVWHQLYMLRVIGLDSFDRQSIQQAIMSDMPGEEKREMLDVYWRLDLNRYSDSTVSDFFDYVRRNQDTVLLRLGKGSTVGEDEAQAVNDDMAKEMIGYVDNGEITFADMEEAVELAQASNRKLEPYMLRELMRPGRKDAMASLEKALALFESHPVIEPEPYMVAGFMRTSNQEDFDNLKESLTLFESKGKIIATDYLLDELLQSVDKESTYKGWKKLMDSFAEGNFDADNELHRNLEYTRFRRIVDDERANRHVKNHFTFEEYTQIFERQEEGEPFSEEDMFEIECVVDESILLRDFILGASRKAAEQGRKTLVVPNLSYGYLPVSPLIGELEGEGVEFLIGAKIGSTQCHDNKEYTVSRLFKGRRTKLMREQPLVIAVDGTEHLLAREGEDKAARYPDAHIGYLNQAIAMNDALGYVNKDYSMQGKSPQDIDKLRKDPEFQRSVEVFKHVLKERKGGRPYNFEFWNTAGMNLIIRNYHQKNMDVKPMDVAEMEGPTMVFCNVGLLHEGISEAVKEMYPGYTHKPAKFDDSHKIIAFDFGHDNRGVRYLNKLETEVKKAYARRTSAELSPERFMPEIVRYIEKQGRMPTVCEQN